MSDCKKSVKKEWRPLALWFQPIDRNATDPDERKMEEAIMRIYEPQNAPRLSISSWDGLICADVWETVNEYPQWGEVPSMGTWHWPSDDQSIWWGLVIFPMTTLFNLCLTQGLILGRSRSIRIWWMGQNLRSGIWRRFKYKYPGFRRR